MRKMVAGLVLLGILLGLGLWRNEKCRASYEQSFFAMDTFYRVQLVMDQGLDGGKAVADVQAEVARIEALTSRYATADGGNVAMINAQAGLNPVQVDSELYDLLAFSKKWSEKTEGDFSLTVGPLVDLWAKQKPPNAQELDLALSLVDDDALVLNQAESTVFLLEKGMSLDLGAVAKGYALDRAKAIVETYGFKDGMIDGGGSIVTFGVNPKGQPWQIGLAHPRRSETLICRLALSDLAVISSGDYQRYFEYEGKRYHHILDPHTGYPAQGVMAVTILAPSATVADILSTAVFVGGSEKLSAYQEMMTGAMLMDDQQSMIRAGDFDKYEIKEKP